LFGSDVCAGRTPLRQSLNRIGVGRCETLALHARPLIAGPSACHSAGSATRSRRARAVRIGFRPQQRDQLVVRDRAAPLAGADRRSAFAA
jgi:hypothetical protein